MKETVISGESETQGSFSLRELREKKNPTAYERTLIELLEKNLVARRTE